MLPPLLSTAAPNLDPVMSSSSTVTYTSVYTNSEPGRVFWGADEELSDGGPEHPPSPDYVPGPEHPPSPVKVPYVPEPEYPKYLVPSDAEAPLEDQPLPADASPTALSPGYVPSDDNDDEDDNNDEDEEPFEDKDDDEEEEEHLDLTETSSVVPVVNKGTSATDNIGDTLCGVRCIKNLESLYLEDFVMNLKILLSNVEQFKNGLALTMSGRLAKNKLLQAELANDSKDIQANLLKRIKILENYFKRSQAQNIDFELKLQHQKEKMACENQDLLITISELKNKLKAVDKGQNVNTKFDKSEISGTLLCVTSLPKNNKDVFMLSHEECVSCYALSRDSRVKRALFTTPLAAKSKNLGVTFIVSKSRLSVAKTPTATNKVSSTLSLSFDSSQSLGPNLFSVGQFCDGDLEVAFRLNTCYVRNLEGDDLITGSRESNVYTISISELAASSPVCLMSKATSKNHVYGTEGFLI
ncbi:hypothetical protein Tco_0339486 [Tanacetum coccineum]